VNNSVTEAASLSAAELLEMFRQMVRIRRFEDRLYQLFLQGLVPGTLHQYQGQEAVAVGVCAALNPEDIVFSTHRPVGHAIAKGVALAAIAGEIWGKETGCSGGRGGQMHLSDVSVGFMPSNAVVGANIPIAVGAAMGFAIRGLDRVAVSFFGDGAANIGAFHEGLNLAAVRSAPVIFVCENNQYGASTHISLAMKIENIADRAAAYGMPGYSVDGMDVAAVFESTQEAVERARIGDGPTLLEYKTYRYMGHSRGDPGRYREAQEVERWRQRDPIALCRGRLLNEFKAAEAKLVEIEESCQAEVEAAIQAAQAAPEPAADQLRRHVYAERQRTDV
jgi:TPP-dependent pyruvate/acetoin dehydrogenase alpha subunit